jgi:hypothetical protein
VPGGTGDEKGAGTSDFSSQLLVVLGAIATGIGVAGFAAVVGGIVVWLRFDALHLPADTAVAAMPRTELIVIGVSTLLPFIALGLALVVLAYVFAANRLVPSRSWVDLPAVWSGAELGPGNDPPPKGSGAASSPEKEAKTRLATLMHDVREATARASAAGRVGRPPVVEDQLALISEVDKALGEEFKWLANLPADTPSPLVRLKPALSQAEAAVAAAKVQAQSAKSEADERQTRSRSTIIVSTFILLALEMVLVIVRGAPSTPQTILLGVTGLGLTITTLRLAESTPGFAVFGASIFISILLFGTATTLLSTYHTPKVQPMALLRSGQDTGLTGFFVAETSDRVYLVRIQGKQSGTHFEPSFPRLVVIPRSSVVAMEVGPLQTQSSAYGTSYRQLVELCAQKVAEPQAKSDAQPKAPPAVPCGEQH